MNSLLNKDTVPDSKEIFSAISSLPPKQKIFTIFLLVAFCIGLAGIAWNINNLFLVDAAVRGGSLSEGTIGTPRFVNPILATSDTDRDLTLLIFSGLMRTDDTGNLIPDLADSYEVSADGLTYNFKLREGLVWHDGEKFTVDDIIFTVQKIQDRP